MASNSVAEYPAHNRAHRFFARTWGADSDVAELGSRLARGFGAYILRPVSEP